MNPFQYYSDRVSQKSTTFLSEEISDSVWQGIYQLKDKYAENLAKNFPQKRDTFKTSGIVDFDERGFLNSIASHGIDLSTQNGKLDFIEFIFNSLRDRNPRMDQKDEYKGVIVFWAYQSNGIEAQKKFQEEANLIFQSNNLVYQLNGNGEISKKVPEGFQDLVSQDVEYPNEQKQKIQEAIKQFYSKDTSINSKKMACRELADVLEPIRTELRTTPELQDDESAIFNLVNNFGIRHNNNSQKEIDDPVYWDWIFYMLLNTVVTFYKLKNQTR